MLLVTGLAVVLRGNVASTGWVAGLLIFSDHTVFRHFSKILDAAFQRHIDKLKCIQRRLSVKGFGNNYVQGRLHGTGAVLIKNRKLALLSWLSV